VGLLADPVLSLDEFLTWVETTPDDVRYEVVEGRPVVVPSATGPHQTVIARLTVLLDRAGPPGWQVLPAPFDWVLWQVPSLTLRQPDLVVVTLEQARGARLTEAPLLAVEVVSPSSVERDTVTKRREYPRAGVRHYWLVDPTAPEVQVLGLTGDGDYAMLARATGTEPLRVVLPFPITLRPADLCP
jgi:Uma2 family endonuclease